MADPAPPGDRVAGARVSPLVPLALLETLRSTDAPEEILEDEDVRQSLPRRLGLSEAVDAQIHRYRGLQQKGAWLGSGEMADLMELVARRPDSVDVFEEAGRWLLHRSLEAASLGRLWSGLAAAPMPRALRRRLALRAARGVARLTNPGGEVRTETDPPAIVVEGSFPPASGAPDACGLTAGALRAALALHSAGGDAPLRVVHPLCEARGDRCCVWRSDG